MRPNRLAIRWTAAAQAVESAKPAICAGAGTREKFDGRKNAIRNERDRPFAGEDAHHCRANPAGAAGDDHHLVVPVEVHQGRVCVTGIAAVPAIRFKARLLGES